MKKKYNYFIIAMILAFGFQFSIAQSYEMVDVVGGTMKIGATLEQESDAYTKEFPEHTVTVRDFKMGVYEVKQSEWISIMGDNPSLNKYSGNLNPVDYIDWMSAIIFCNEATIAEAGLGLSECIYYKDAAFTNPFTKTDYSGGGNTPKADVYMDLSKSGYRFPTEAEWEFAARGGIAAQGKKYAGSDNIEQVAVTTINSDWVSSPVGSKSPNELGLYDMSGNVWEMVNDWYGAYVSGPSSDPTGPATGTHRVVRGGAYDYAARMCRVSTRYMVLPDDKDSDIGFRLVRNK